MTKGMAANGGQGLYREEGHCRWAPPQRATGPPAIFFDQGPPCEFEKKITLRACRPMGGRPGGIFEIFQNGHIFLKF